LFKMALNEFILDHSTDFFEVTYVTNNSVRENIYGNYNSTDDLIRSIRWFQLSLRYFIIFGLS
jgi:hypothetical protein